MGATVRQLSAAHVAAIVVAYSHYDAIIFFHLDAIYYCHRASKRANVLGMVLSAKAAPRNQSATGVASPAAQSLWLSST